MSTQPQNRLNSLLLWILVGSGLVLSFFLLFQQILMPFMVALIIAYILKPIVEKLLVLNISRNISATLLVGGFLLFLITVIFFAIPFLKHELLFLAQKLPSYLQFIKDSLTPYVSLLLSYVDPASVAKIQDTLTAYFGNMFSWILRLFADLFTSTLALANLISLIILTPLITFYVLRDWPKIEKFFSNLVPKAAQRTYDSLLNDIQQTLSAYFRGQALVCLLLTVYYISGLALIGLDFAFIIGFLGGLLTFIPYIGFIIGLMVALGIALFQFASINGVLLVLAVYGSGHILEAFVLTPKLIGDRIGLHPVWVIFSLLAGGLIAGFSGILLAMPVAAIIAILLRALLRLYQQSQAFLGRPLPSTPLKSTQIAKSPQQEGM